MLEFLNEAIANSGLIAIFILMIINGLVGTPPSELILFMAGIFAFATDYSLYHTIPVTVIANIISAYTLFLVGRTFGYKWIFKFRYFADKADQEKIRKITKKFHKKGAYWVGIFRCLPLGRTIISIPAGMIKMPHMTFLIYSLIGIIIWATFWQLMGYFIGMSFLQYKAYATLFLLGILGLVILVFKKELKYYHEQIENEK